MTEDVTREPEYQQWLDLLFACMTLTTFRFCPACRAPDCPHVRAAVAASEHLPALLKLAESNLPKPAAGIGADIPF